MHTSRPAALSTTTSTPPLTHQMMKMSRAEASLKSTSRRHDVASCSGAIARSQACTMSSRTCDCGMSMSVSA
jgi:hypothetical protein